MGNDTNGEFQPVVLSLKVRLLIIAALLTLVVAVPFFFFCWLWGMVNVDVAEAVPVQQGPVLAIDDPSKDGWETEVLSAQALKQLKQIAREVESGLAEKQPSFVAPDFRSGPLRPAPLNVVYDKFPFMVERESSSSDKSNGHEETRSYSEVIQELRSPFSHEQALRVSVKVFRIFLEEETFVTREFVSILGTTDGHPVEENATWKTRWSIGKKPGLLSLQVEDFERTTLKKTRPLFTDCTTAVLKKELEKNNQLTNGVSDWWSRLQKIYGVGRNGQHGVACADVNGDGLDDVFLCHPGGVPNQLFIRQPDGTVVNRAKEVGVDWLDQTSSALFVDLDNDGDQDLVMGISGTGQNAVLENVGNTRLEVRFLSEKIRGYTRSLSSADFDNDGDLDFYQCLYGATGPVPFHDANNGPANRLWRNDGDWKFTDITEKAGMDVNNRRFSLAAAWEDFDNDGDQDLYVANDFGRNNLFENLGNGEFEDIAPEMRVEDSAGGMSVSFSDFDHDGKMDLYIGNMFSSAGNRISFQENFNPRGDQFSRSLFQRFARGNTLFRARPDGGFEDVSVDAGVTMGRWAWSSRFVDVNNDSFDDLCIANGYITNARKHDL